MHDCTTLEEYLGRYGKILGKQARKSLAPLHVPGRDPCAGGELHLKRTPFDAQAHVVTAIKKALKRQKSLLLVAECGTGKTMMGMAAVHAHAEGRGYRALVFCPGQLTEKWAREIRQTIPDVQVTQIESWRDLLNLTPNPRPLTPSWYVIARDRAKLGAKWRAAVVLRRDLCHCPRCGAAVINEKKDLPIPLSELAKKKTNCPTCSDPLWQYTPQIKRWEPAKYIHKRMRGFFDYLILDEVHEEKGANTAQANAAGSLAAASKKVIALTGTLIGGYAEHLRPLLFRLAPRTLVAEGFGWSDVLPFNEAYGRIELRITERSGGGADNTQSRGSSVSKSKYVRPGVMPTLFGRHLIGNCVFPGLSEVAENLPNLEETVRPVPMDDRQRTAYKKMENSLKEAVKRMVCKGDKRLLGPMLNVLLGWVDSPYDWDPIGYYDKGPDGGKGAFVTVTMPPDLDGSVVRPKERSLLELVREERLYGRQTWVFVQMTNKHDVAGRLDRLLRMEGLRVKVLRSSVPLAKREAWIARHAPGIDVMISHPKLVETGLDLFDKGGSTTSQRSCSTKPDTIFSPCGRPAGAPGGSASAKTAGCTTSTTKGPCRTGP